MRERQQRHAHEQEDERQRGQQDGQRDLVGRLLPFAPSTSAIMRSRKVCPDSAVTRTTIGRTARACRR
jgi:hypothetical protein